MPNDAGFKVSFKDQGGDSVLALERKANALRVVEDGGVFSGTGFKEDESANTGDHEILKAMGGRQSSAERKSLATSGRNLLRTSMDAVGAADHTS